MFGYEKNRVYTVYIQSPVILDKSESCQKINFKKIDNILLQIEMNLINCLS